MRIQAKISQSALPFIVACLASLSLIFFASLAAEGQTTIHIPSEPGASEEASARGIVFPVAELGNCANKTECKNYCNQPANMEACIAFAKGHGLMTEADAARAEKFTKHVQEGSGPGGCNSPKSCEEYCSNLSNLDECTGFAEKNGFKDEHYEQGKKIQGFLKKGGTTPGGCRTKQECEAYCGDFSHAKECFEFAQKAGIMQKGGKGPSSGGSHEPNAEQMEKIMMLSQSGETPGQCNSKDACEKYCSDASHREECLDFGVKIGFIHPDEAAKIKQMGGKGPGGCDSQKSCQEYCNDQSHHEECFKFAEEHGFMSKEEAVQAKEGWMRARQGFENAPPEARECLKTTLGGNIIDDIQSGKLVPGPDIANQVRGCFEKFGGNAHPEAAMKNLPPEITSCLKEKFGDTFEKIRTGAAPMTPETADSFRVCFQSMHLEESFMHKDPVEGQRGSGANLPPQGIGDMLRSAPPEIVACVKEKFPEGLPSVQAGNAGLGMDIKEKIRGCFENFRPMHQGAKPMPEPRGGGMNGGVPQSLQDMVRSAPPAVAECIKAHAPEWNSTESGVPQDIKEKIRKCFEVSGGQNTGEPQYWTEENMRNAQPAPNTRIIPPPSAGQASFMNMPPEVVKCLQESLGAEGLAKLQSAPASPELVGMVKTCIEKTMQMRMEQNGTAGGEFPPPPPSGDSMNTGYPSKEVPPPGDYTEPTTTQPITFLEKFVAAALMPLRWILGK
ncbi:MAG: hypothetical protein HYT94_01645 [Parcubacteria group bacterium]|nr:hypothetical protein [Parcubacteria group bacterium]